MSINSIFCNDSNLIELSITILTAYTVELGYNVIKGT
jgi:hypothetical protein